MGVKGKGSGSFDVEWTILDKDGNVKDSGILKEETLNGDVSE